MRTLLVSTLSFVLAASALGQHASSGGHAGGGFTGGGLSSGRSFAAPSGGFSRNSSTVGSRYFGSAPAYNPSALRSGRPQYSSPVGPAPFGGAYPYGGNSGGGSRGGNRGGGRRPYYPRGGYVYPGLLGGFYDYGYPGYGYSDDSADQQQQATAPVPDESEQQVARDPYQDPYGEAGYPPPYPQMPARAAYEPQSTASSDLPDPKDQPKVTLLFKDGRPPQQVQNYAVTRTTLYVLDGAKRREIPLEQLNLPLTEKMNNDAGIDFQVPESAD